MKEREESWACMRRRKAESSYGEVCVGCQVRAVVELGKLAIPHVTQCPSTHSGISGQPSAINELDPSPGEGGKPVKENSM